MKRRLVAAFCLSLFLLAPACKGTEQVVGTPMSGSEGRTFAGMLPNLKKSLTPLLAEEKFGIPDQAIGSGLVIFVYNVEDGKKVNLAFPGMTSLISYASLQDKNGGVTPIVLAD